MKPGRSGAPLLWVLARGFVGLVYAYAGFSKLTEPVENFRAVIAAYEMIPYGWTSVIAHGLPWLEFLFGVFMILGYAPRLSALVLFFLSFGFLAVLGSSNVLLEAGSKDCGCFGQGGWLHLSVRQIFALDTVNLLLALKIFLQKEYPWSLDQWLRRPGASLRTAKS